MNCTVAVYQRKRDAELDWVTVGLGPQTCRRSGKNALKLQQKLVEDLRRVMAGLTPQELAPFKLSRGVRLEHVRLELSLRGEGGRRKFAGVYPLVLDPRAMGEDAPLLLAYHPERQQDWFPVNEAEPLEDQAAIFFNKTLAEVSDEGVVQLQSNRKDLLKSIAFVAWPKTLLDRLPREKGIWDDLDVDFVKGREKKEKGKYKALDRLGVNLSLQAIDGSLNAGLPRSPYREQLQLLLGGEKRTPLLLVGAPGCGKSTLLRRFIKDLLDGDGFQMHRNLDRIHEVWSLSGKRIIAGMSYVGDWEQRCLEVLDDARHPKRLLVLEDISAFGRIGRSRDSDSNLALFFQGPLARGEITLVGECTPEQLQRLEDDAPSFAALFTQLRVHPTSSTETMKMVLHESRRLEVRHKVDYEPHVFSTIMEQAGSLFPSTAFPGKALDLLRELARTCGDRGYVATARTWELLQLLSRKTGLPLSLLKPGEALAAKDVEAALSRQVMGQEEGVAAGRDLVLRIRAGLTDSRRPYAVYLFTGPTGTGKTEMARATAAYLFGDESRLLRFDMGEFATPDAVSRLCGDAFSPEGLLTRAVRAQPFCVVLLDEIEKAHPRS